MSAGPDSRKSPGLCHIRRQGNRSAQKQIICPIYRGSSVTRLYKKGVEPENLAGTRPRRDLQEMNNTSFFRQKMNHGFLRLIQRVTTSRFARLIRQDYQSVFSFRRGGQRSLRIRRRHHEIGDAWHDFRFEAGTVEDAVMPDALLHVMHPAMTGDRRA